MRAADGRRRAEAREDALRESERESRLVVDSIPGFVAAFTPDGEVEFVNRPILEYFGKTMEELKRWGTGGSHVPLYACLRPSQDSSNTPPTSRASVTTATRAKPGAGKELARRTSGLPEHIVEWNATGPAS